MGSSHLTNSKGGGGSGGAIRLMAPLIGGVGSLNARGSIGCETSGVNGNGSHGRIRLEAFLQQFTGSIEPVSSVATPGLIFPPATGPSVRVVSIDGIDLPASVAARVYPLFAGAQHRRLWRDIQWRGKNRPIGE